jgi:tetratricopeptide (TPR) repeat protein
MDSESVEHQATPTETTGAGIHIGGDVNTGGGNFVGRDQIIRDNVITVIGSYIRSPRTFYEDLRTLVSAHPNIIALLIVAQAAFLFLFLRFKDRYLPSCWDVHYLSCWDSYILLVFLLFVTGAGWLGGQRGPQVASSDRSRYRVGWLGVTALAGLTSIGLLTWQLWPLWHPTPFDPDTFGIGIATFGSGSGYGATADGYEIASRIYSQLNTALTNNEALRDAVAIRRIGVIGDTGEQIKQVGEAIGAELVVWGRLVRRGENVDVHFKVMQDPTLMDNPAYPESIPMTEQAVENSLTLAYVQSDSLKEVIEQQSLGIAAFSLGLARYANRNYAEAAKHFEAAIASFDEGASADQSATYPTQNLGLLYYYLGRCYQFLGRFEASQRMYEEAERFSPREVAILLGKIYNYRVFGEEAARLATYRQILDFTSTRTDIQSRYNRALAFEEIDEFDRALTELHSIIEQEPDFYVAYLSAAHLLVEQERFDEAQALYDKAAALAEGDRIRQIWLELGQARLYKDAGQIDAAIAALQRALELDRDQAVPSLYYQLAQLYASEQRVDEAIASYQELIRISAIPNWSHSALGEYYASQNQCQAAVDEFELALDYPAYNNSILYGRLGLAYTCLADQQRQQQRQLAIQSEQQAIKAFEEGVRTSNCSEAWVRHEYGRSLYQFGKVAEAIEQFTLAIEPGREKGQGCPIELGFQVKTLRNLGQLYEIQGEVDAARLRYEQIIMLCAENEPATLLAQVDFAVLEFVKERLELLGGDATRCFSLFSG